MVKTKVERSVIVVNVTLTVEEAKFIRYGGTIVVECPINNGEVYLLGKTNAKRGGDVAAVCRATGCSGVQTFPRAHRDDNITIVVK